MGVLEILCVFPRQKTVNKGKVEVVRLNAFSEFASEDAEGGYSDIVLKYETIEEINYCASKVSPGFVLFGNVLAVNKIGMAFFNRMDKLRYFLWRVLQIVIHSDQQLSR